MDMVDFEKNKKDIYRISVYYDHLNDLLNAFFGSNPVDVDEEINEIYEKLWLDIQNLMIFNETFLNNYKVGVFQPLPLDFKYRNVEGLKVEWDSRGFNVCERSMEYIDELIEDFEIEDYRLENYEYDFLAQVKKLQKKFEDINQIKSYPDKNKEVDFKLKDDNLSSEKELPSFWDIVHEDIINVSKKKFEDEHYSAAVESAFKEVNSRVKRLYQGVTGKELDGRKLMFQAFEFKYDKNKNIITEDPAICLTDLASESKRNIQEGYKFIFGGTIQGIRNPNAHENIDDIEPEETIHLIFIASHLMYKLDDCERHQQDSIFIPESQALNGQDF